MKSVIFSIIIVALLAFASCSNAAGSSGSSGGGATETFDADSVLVEWEPFLANYEASVFGKPSYAEDRSGDSSGDYSIDYQWQLALSADADAGSWEDKQSASSGEDFFYEPSASDIGKFLRVKIDWKYDGQDQSPIYSSAVKIENRLDLSGLSYNDYVKEGSCVDASKVTGEIKALDEQSVSDRSIIAVEPSEKMYFSDYVIFEVSAAGYPTEQAAIFVPVQGVLSLNDVPPLSTDIVNISKGKVKFRAAASELEYSLDGGSTYDTLDAEEIDYMVVGGFVPNAEILVRKKSLGVKTTYDEQNDTYSYAIDTGDCGYRKESEPVTVIVETKNIGVDTNEPNNIVEGLSNLKLELDIVDKNDNDEPLEIIAVTATLSNDEAIQELYDAVKVYRWIVDDSEIVSNDPTAPMYWAGDGQTLILNRRKLETDTYQVECRVSFKADPEDSQEEEFAPVSEQKSVVVQKIEEQE